MEYIPEFKLNVNFGSVFPFKALVDSDSLFPPKMLGLALELEEGNFPPNIVISVLKDGFTSNCLSLAASSAEIFVFLCIRLDDGIWAVRESSLSVCR